MTYNIKRKRKTNKDIGYNNSSRRLRPIGSRVMALSMKCDSLALRTESREEYQRNRFRNQIVKEPPPI